MKPFRGMLLFFLAAGASNSEAKPVEWLYSLQAALDKAKTEDKPLLIDFQAPWCYSCYYMERRVLGSRVFESYARKRINLLVLDVDTPEGRSAKERYGVRVLPSYIILNREQREIGRILGEQTRDRFLASLKKILKTIEPSPIDRLRFLVESNAPTEAKVERDFFLNAHPRLPEDPAWRIQSARLDHQLAILEKNDELAVHALLSLLGDEKGCDLAYDVARAAPFIKKLQPGKREAILTTQFRKLQRLLETRVFVSEKRRCADIRTPVRLFIETSRNLGRPRTADAAQDRILEQLDAEYKRVKLGDDRNRDDNYRFFLEASGRVAELDEIYPKLAALYPYDFVYPYRYARNLLGRGRIKAAWDWSQKASGLSYGANRIRVTLIQAQILDKLEEWAQARHILRRDIQAHKGNFPELVAPLEDLLPRIEAKHLVAVKSRPKPSSEKEKPAHPARFRD